MHQRQRAGDQPLQEDTLIVSDEEIIAAESGAAIMTHSSPGRIRITGPDRLDLIHRLSTNDLLGLGPNSSTGSVFTTDKGRIVDYVRVMALPDSLMLFTSPGQESAFEQWIARYTIMESISLSVITSDTTMYSIVGPKAFETARSIFSDVPPAGRVTRGLVETAAVTLDHQHEFGIERINIVLDSADAPRLLQTILKAGESPAVAARVMSKPAYQYFRILHGIPDYNHELVDLFNPYEVGLRHAISFTKGCYIGQEVIARLDTYQKIHKGLALIRFDQRMPHLSTPVGITKDADQIGTLTSFSEASFRGGHVGLGVVRKDGIAVGDEVGIQHETLFVKGIIMNFF